MRTALLVYNFLLIVTCLASDKDNSSIYDEFSDYEMLKLNQTFDMTNGTSGTTEETHEKPTVLELLANIGDRALESLITLVSSLRTSLGFGENREEQTTTATPTASATATPPTILTTPDPTTLVVPPVSRKMIHKVKKHQIEKDHSNKTITESEKEK